MSDKIREEFEKTKREYEGCFPNPYLNLNFDDFSVGYKSRDEEIKKFQSIAEDYENTYTQIEKVNHKLRDALDLVINNTIVNQRGIAIQLSGDIDIGYLISLKGE